MKQLRGILLAAILFLSVLPCQPVYAVGEGNVDNGGGGMGQGTNSNKWTPGNDGVRVTVVRLSDHAVVTAPIDLTNKHPDGLGHFQKVSKLEYTNGAVLSPSMTGYTYVNPAQSLPKIMSSQSLGQASIAQIKSYFTDEQVIRSIANLTGMDFNVLINGEYRLLIEPVAYVTFQGSKNCHDRHGGGIIR